MFAQLGDIRFDLITYFNGLEGSQAYDFAEHKVIEGKPRLQYVGDGLEEVRIELLFHREFCFPEGEMQRLREAAATHRAHPFLFGNGLYKGRFVITELTTGTIQTTGDGSIIAMGARLVLKEWVETEPLEIRQQEQKATAPAVKKQKANRSTAARKAPAKTKDQKTTDYEKFGMLNDPDRIVRRSTP